MEDGVFSYGTCAIDFLLFLVLDLSLMDLQKQP